MEDQEIINRLSLLPSEIRDAEEAYITKVENQEKNILKKDLIETSTALDIENTTDLDGKKLFTNELKRKVATEERLRDHKEYQALLQNIKDARHELKMDEIMISYKKRLFNSIESTVRILRGA